jgi:hypothetical protein
MFHTLGADRAFDSNGTATASAQRLSELAESLALLL